MINSDSFIKCTSLTALKLKGKTFNYIQNIFIYNICKSKKISSALEEIRGWSTKNISMWDGEVEMRLLSIFYGSDKNSV